jgi:hypothetical protein
MIIPRSATAVWTMEMVTEHLFHLILPGTTKKVLSSRTAAIQPPAIIFLITDQVIFDS